MAEGTARLRAKMAPREAGVEKEKRVLALDAPRPTVEEFHGDSPAEETGPVSRGQRAVGGNDIAHLPSVRKRLRVAVPREIDDQPVPGFVPVPSDELVHSLEEGLPPRILQNFHRKTLLLEGLFHLRDILFHAGQVGPSRRIIRNAYDQRMARCVQLYISAALPHRRPHLPVAGVKPCRRDHKQ